MLGDAQFVLLDEVRQARNKKYDDDVQVIASERARALFAEHF